MRIEQGASGSDSPSSIKKYFLCQQHRPPGAKPFMPMYENEDDDDDDDCRKKNKDGKSNIRGSGRKCKKRNQLLINDACDIDDDEDDGFYLDDDDEEFSLVKKTKKVKSKSDNEMGYTKKCKKLNKSFKDADDNNDKSKSKSNKSKNINKSFKSTSHTTIINPYKLELPSISPKMFVSHLSSFFNFFFHRFNSKLILICVLKLTLNTSYNRNMLCPTDSGKYTKNAFIHYNQGKK